MPAVQARGGVDLALIAEDPAVPLSGLLLVTAELDARIAGHVELGVEFEAEVSVVFSVAKNVLLPGPTSPTISPPSTR